MSRNVVAGHGDPLRAQLVGKTERPRALATRAASLLAAGAPAMRRAGLSAVVDVDPHSV